MRSEVLFNEKVHGYMAMKFYSLMKNNLENGVDKYKEATIEYGKQRGRRMAKRAKADGAPLDYANYCGYSEWMATGSAICPKNHQPFEILEDPKDRVTRINCCLWHDQFAQMGELEGSLLYCSIIDKAIVDGFNPEISFETIQTLNDHDCCIQIIRNCANIKGNPKKIERTKDFQYHCAHLFWSYLNYLKKDFPDDYKLILSLAQDEFLKDYNPEMLNSLMSYQNCDFDEV